jgi:NADPH:quinone reductase-like Zn-dependent oxidoreductase
LSVKDVSEVGDRVSAACSFVNSGAGAVLPHLRWELEQVMSRVHPEDLSAAEVAALLAILMPAHARVIGGPPGRPRLRVLGSRREHAAFQPA